MKYQVGQKLHIGETESTIVNIEEVTFVYYHVETDGVIMRYGEELIDETFEDSPYK